MKQKQLKNRASFDKLLLGTRFRCDKNNATWVKLSWDGSVAIWEEDKITSNYIKQGIFDFSDYVFNQTIVTVIC